MKRHGWAVATLVVGAVGAGQGATYTWNVNAVGPTPWDDASHWTPSTGYPDGVDDVANLTNNITVSNQITNRVPVTIGMLNIGDAIGNSDFIILAGSPITFDASSGSAAITRTATGTGADAINTALILNDDLVVTVNSANGSLTLAGLISESVGGRSLTKSGPGTLTLSGTNTFSGGVTINAGSLTVGARSLGTGSTLTFAGSATVSPAYGVYPRFQQGVTVNGVTATFSVPTQYYKIYFTGPLAGSGTLYVAGATGGAAGEVAFTNVNNTFTGTIDVYSPGNGSLPLIVNSLPDSTNSIRLRGSTFPATFRLGSGIATSLVFHSRRIELSGGGAGGTVENSNAEVTRTITIRTDLLYTGSGHKTLTLGGSNLGTNLWSGSLTDGPSTSVLTLVKAGAGTWCLDGTNTFSGPTIVSNGTLIVAGSSCLSDTSSLTIRSGAKVRLNAGVKEKVGSLILGTTPQVNGTWGSSASPAENKNDTYFLGSGVLYVGVDPPRPQGTVFILN